MPASALRVMSPRKSKTNLMVLPGTLCVSGAEPGMGLRSLVRVPGGSWSRVAGRARRPCRGRGAGGGAVPGTRRLPASHPLICGRAPLSGQGDRGAGEGGWGQAAAEPAVHSPALPGHPLRPPQADRR